MLHLRYPRPANQALVLTCLLAVTSFLACTPQVGAQTSPATRVVTPPSIGGSMMRLEGHVPQKVLDGTAIRVGHKDSTQHLRLALYIRPQHQAEEAEYIRELTTKGSPNFHKFLTLDEIIARYSPSVEDEQAVVDWATSQGLTVTHRFPNRLLVDVEGTIATIEKAFDVTINNYQVGDEVDFANDRDPLIPAQFSGKLGGVLGLTSVEKMHAASALTRKIKDPDYVPGAVYQEGPSDHGDGDPIKFQSKTRAAAASAGLEPGFTNNYADPGDIFTSQAYNWDGLERFSHCCNVHNDSGGAPAVSSIALATFAGFNGSDLQAFFQMYGFAWDYNAYRIDGTSGEPGTECNVGASGCDSVAVDDEATLDTEYSTASANSYGSYLDTAHVYIYEGANQLYNTYADIYNFMLNDGHAKVMSTSWSGTEATSGNNLTYWEDADDAIYQNMVAAGWTLIGDADDQGSTGNCSTISVNFPASDPNFIAAGGTELGLYSNGDWDGEVAWTGGTTTGDCGKNDGGGGGGVSAVFAQPYWQNQYSSLGSMRLMPDISLNAGGIGENYYYNGTLSPVGGTSIVAPELAGFFAQENTYLNYIGNICGSSYDTACTPVGLANPFFYEASSSGSHVPFYDITSGCTSNDVTVANGLTAWCAGTGYDLATGLGSANMMQLAWGINWELIPAYGLPAITFNSTPATNTWFNSDQIVGWTVADTNTDTSIAAPPSGVAGFTQGWDSIPADPYSEAHGGSGNSFYSGPEFAFSTGGCLAFDGDGGCGGSPGQGCHTAHVEAWDNQGRTSTAAYGPVCYDTVDPTITPSTSPATSGTVWVDKSVTVTLTAADPGGSNASGIKGTYYGIDITSCAPGSLSTCTKYTGPFVQAETGQHYIYYFTEDNAGNYSNFTYFWTSIDEIAPTTTATPSGDLQGGTYYSNVSITLNASDTGGSGVAATYYTVDGGAQKTYSGSALVETQVGSHTIKYWSVDVAGNVESQHTLTFTVAPETAATLTAPIASTVLGPSVTFTWGAEAGVNGYFLHIGTTGAGSENLLNSTEYSAGTTSVTINNLPTAGGTIYVRLFTDYAGTHVYHDYSFTAAKEATITSPTPTTTLPGPAVTFSWSAATGSVTGYYLQVGTTGAGSDNLYNSPELSTATTSKALSNIPTTGGSVFVRLSSSYGGTMVYQDYAYYAPAEATMSSPTQNSTFAGPSVTFKWAEGTGTINGYFLHVGTTGVGSMNLLNSAEYSNTTSSVTLSSLPTTGGQIYVRLFTDYSGTHVYQDYLYTASTQAMISSPAQMTTLPGPTATFSWTPANGGETGYFLHIGSTGVGSDNILNSSEYNVDTSSVTITDLPTGGGPIYVRLYTDYSGTHLYEDYVYTAASQATLVSPAQGSTLTGSSATFTWSAATGSINGYFLHIGSTGVGSDNLLNSTEYSSTTTSATVTGLPTTGGTLYVRVFTDYNGVHVYKDYTINAE